MFHLFNRLGACALVIVGISLPAHSEELLDRIVAVANEDVVTANELVQRTRTVREQYASNPGVLPPQDQLRRQILDALILERLQLQLADSINLRITDSQVNSAVNRLAQQRNMTLEQFISALQSNGQDYPTVREQVRQELTIGEVRRQYVGRTVRVTEGEIERYLNTLAGQSLAEAEFELAYRRFAPEEAEAARALRTALNQGERLTDDTEARNLGLRKVNELPSVFRTVVPVMELDEAVLVERDDALHLAQLISKNERRAVQVDQYRVRHILIRPNVVLNEDQAQALLTDLRERIADGEDMASLANQFTDDLGSKGNGGDLGWRQAEEFVRAFAGQVRSMPAGEISPVFQSEFGYHILRVEDQRTQDIGLDVLRQQVRESLSERKYQEALERWLVELRAQSFVEVRL
ncbi:peptidylprolyl isomerase [Saccharospirillum impatiens]|uniref:peptidylprolyl isomerase n=1 Tax=Saccharospirillum impatiens TaxID=169438 RepID=UPI00146D64A2|nr:peptidylprolyl isomerase [Saccharospirillum impatiens]